MSEDRMQQISSSGVCNSHSQSPVNNNIMFSVNGNSNDLPTVPNGISEVTASDGPCIQVKSCLVRRPSNQPIHTGISFNSFVTSSFIRDQSGCLSDPLPMTSRKPCCTTNPRGFSSSPKGTPLASLESRRRHSHVDVPAIKRSSQSRSPPPPISVVRAIDDSARTLPVGEHDQELVRSGDANGPTNDELPSPFDAPPLAQAVVAALKHQHQLFRSTTTTTSTASSSRFSPSYLSDENEDDGDYEDVEDEMESDVEDLLAANLVSHANEIVGYGDALTEDSKTVEVDAESGYGASCSSSSTRLCRSNGRRDKRRYKRRIQRKVNAGTNTVSNTSAIAIDDSQQDFHNHQHSSSGQPRVDRVEDVDEQPYTGDSKRSANRSVTTRHKRNRVRILDDSSPNLRDRKPLQRSARRSYDSLNGFHSSAETRTDLASEASSPSYTYGYGTMVDPSSSRIIASFPNLHGSYRRSLDDCNPSLMAPQVQIPSTDGQEIDGNGLYGLAESSSPNTDLGPAPGAAMPPPADAVPTASILVSGNAQISSPITSTNHPLPLLSFHRNPIGAYFNDGSLNCYQARTSVLHNPSLESQNISRANVCLHHKAQRSHYTTASAFNEGSDIQDNTVPIASTSQAVSSVSPPCERRSAFSPAHPDPFQSATNWFPNLAEQFQSSRRFSAHSDVDQTTLQHSLPVANFHMAPFDSHSMTKTGVHHHSCGVCVNHIRRHDRHPCSTTCYGCRQPCPLHSRGASMLGFSSEDHDTGPHSVSQIGTILRERRDESCLHSANGAPRSRSQAGSPPTIRTKKLSSNGYHGAAYLSDSPQHGRSQSALEQRRYSVPSEPVYEVNLASPINPLNTELTVAQRVSLVVDNVRFIVDVDRLQAHPDTMLGRMFGSSFSEASRLQDTYRSDSSARIHDGSDSAADSVPLHWKAEQSQLLRHPPDIQIARDSNISAQLFRAILDYYLVGYMMCPPGVAVQELKEACDYFMVPFNHLTVKCSNLRAFLHELSNDGAHVIFERFLEAHILSLLVKCAQLGERECHVVIVTDEETIDWDPEYPPQMPENELHSHIIYSTQMFRFLKYIENREVAKQVLLERGLKKIRIGIEGYPTSKDRVKFRHGVRPEAIYNYVQCPFLRMSWEEEENKSRHVDFQCVKSKSVSDLTTGLEQAVVDPLPPHLARSPLNTLRATSPPNDPNVDVSSFGAQVDTLESDGLLAVDVAPEHSPTPGGQPFETLSPAPNDSDPSPDPAFDTTGVASSQDHDVS